MMKKSFLALWIILLFATFSFTEEIQKQPKANFDKTELILETQKNFADSEEQLSNDEIKKCADIETNEKALASAKSESGCGKPGCTCGEKCKCEPGKCTCKEYKKGEWCPGKTKVGCCSELERKKCCKSSEKAKSSGCHKGMSDTHKGCPHKK